MDVFQLRHQLVQDYAAYVQSFIKIRERRLQQHVETSLGSGLLWPDPLIQLNPSFEPGESIDELVQGGQLEPACRAIFRRGKSETSYGDPMRLHRHQADAVRVARGGHNYVLTTGTGSGKSLAYIVPIVDRVLRDQPRRGIQAIVVYPMNALVNSQANELRKFLEYGQPEGAPSVTFGQYTGQERGEERRRLLENPPNILLTNYVMLELILTRPGEHDLVQAAHGLQFLVLDELHTYRGRQGADVALLVRRTRDLLAADKLQCVGTSATLAGDGTFDAQRAEVAEVATRLFGAEVQPEHVIGETLRAATPRRETSDPAFVRDLTMRVRDLSRRPPTHDADFVADPLSIWIEHTFGIQTEPGTDRLIRAKPRGITGPEGAARDLAGLTGQSEARCASVIQEGLLAGYTCVDPATQFPAFAFRLHQFISRGDTVYATPESEPDRYISLEPQTFVPGDRTKVLLPLAFCRECGQEYYTVRVITDAESGVRQLVPRDLSNRLGADQAGQSAFLYVSADDPWPRDLDLMLDRLPEDWLEEGRTGTRVRSARRKDLPTPITVGRDGIEQPNGVAGHLLGVPFRLCLRCGVEYGARQTSDFAKLGTLGSEGRSTATTVLTLSTILALKADEDLPASARKLLSFTDNRQDASLQAGHFNDFVEIGVLRAALYRAARDAGMDGLRHDELAQRVFDALALPKSLYAVDPEVKYAAEQETNRALRNVLGYRLYRDLRRGWRITSPNLEQTGLLSIQYESLEDVCTDAEPWQGSHAALVGATALTRTRIARVLLDTLRRGLAIKVDYLDSERLEAIRQQSSQRLKSPWAFDENEVLEHAAVAYPRASSGGDFGGNLFISSRSAFGIFLRRSSTFPEFDGTLKLDDTTEIINGLFQALRLAGLVEVVAEPRRSGDLPGYQAPASSLVWMAGSGEQSQVDPLRTPSAAADGGQANQFFVDFYRAVAARARDLEAREHTAQVRSEIRSRREDAFRAATLPILFCSPTMELGVDIAELNVVNLRNIPPTPANYAQRSGRAGRSGQPALVFSYCSTGSAHDQYFFKRPELMVAGAVSPPRLDLANRELVRAHVQAIWLSEAKLDLGRSLKDVLDVNGENPSLDVLPEVRATLMDPAPQERARGHAQQVLRLLQPLLETTAWWSDEWLDEVLREIPDEFDRACDRWRGLYRSARSQVDVQHLVVNDASRPAEDRRQAERLRREAESQLALLVDDDNPVQSDFYSYRYFASEGFLPGYSFPRLPLSAFIPGRRGNQGREEFLSRPRFLAISEFGPRAVVYHEGSRYIINKVILPVRTGDVLTTSAKQCASCSYIHAMTDEYGPDLCERCGVELPLPHTGLFRLQNVSTRRRDRITSDEEERFRLGYELKTGLRFAEHGGHVTQRKATVEWNGQVFAHLTYGDAATIWRVNLGWRRRGADSQPGFVLDTERGYWARGGELVGDEDAVDNLSAKTQRVIPYVEDRRNCLLIEPVEPLNMAVMASLQAALKQAIQIRYQLEDSELAAEPLPSGDDRRMLLFYESAEGGAGVLRRLVENRDALMEVAHEALELCHFDPATGRDLRRSPRAREDCEAACYSCLMSYTNQGDHRILDRTKLVDLLMDLAAATVRAGPQESSSLPELHSAAAGDLERGWLDFLERNGIALPTGVGSSLAGSSARPDFLYGQHHAVVYIDGDEDAHPGRRFRDADLVDELEDQGYMVIRFGDQEDWDLVIDAHPGIFVRQTGRAGHAPDSSSRRGSA